MWPTSTAACPSASRKWVLPVPDGPHTTRFSWRWIHSRVRSARWVGAGIDDTVSSQASKVLPVGNPAALRRARTDDAWRPASSSVSSARLTASAGSQRCALAVANSSGAAARMWGRRRVRSRSTTSSIGAGFIGRLRGDPRRRCRAAASARHRRVGVVRAGQRPGSRPGRRLRSGRTSQRAPSAQSSRSAPCSRARVTAWAILTFMRVVPAAAASTSQVRAPSPMERNSASAALVGFGRRPSGPAGRGG